MYKRLNIKENLFQMPRGLRSFVCWGCGFEFRIGMDICPLRVLCVVRHRYLRKADHSSRGVLSSVVCRSVISESQQ
jgi:hypothetical protein